MSESLKDNLPLPVNILGATLNHRCFYPEIHRHCFRRPQPILPMNIAYIDFKKMYLFQPDVNIYIKIALQH